jgi:beta-phosphoglucomutase
MPIIKAVLFDLDGVLVDATEWHYEALNRALGLFGFSISRYEHLSTYNGLPTRKKLEMLSVQSKLPMSLHGLISRIKQTYTREEILTQCRPRFEIEYLLSRLKREGYKLAVCSNSIKESVDLMLRQSGIDRYFEFVVSNEEVAKPKPDPEMYLSAIKRLGLEPQDVVVVEDAPQGIRSAEAAGAHVLQVEGVEEVTYSRIRNFIAAKEAGASSAVQEVVR